MSLCLPEAGFDLRKIASSCLKTHKIHHGEYWNDLYLSSRFPMGFIGDMIVIAHGIWVSIIKILMFYGVIADSIVGCHIMALSDVVGPYKYSCSKKMVSMPIEKGDFLAIDGKHLNWAK